MASGLPGPLSRHSVARVKAGSDPAGTAAAAGMCSTLADQCLRQDLELWMHNLSCALWLYLMMFNILRVYLFIGLDAWLGYITLSAR